MLCEHTETDPPVRIARRLRLQIYDYAAPESDWLQRVCGSLVETMDLSQGVYARIATVQQDEIRTTTSVGSHLAFDADEMRDFVANSGLTADRLSVSPDEPFVDTFLGLVARGGLPQLGPVIRARFGESRGIVDWILVSASAASERILLAVPSGERVMMTRRQRELWRWIAVHLAAARRLKCVAACGQRAHRDPASVEGSRELWEGLLDGTWTLLEAFDSGERRVIVAKPSEPHPRPALSQRERDVLPYIVAGQSNKVIAYQLGLADSTVATHVASVLTKLQLASRVELIHLVNSLVGRVSAPVSKPAHPTDPEELASTFGARVDAVARRLSRLSGGGAMDPAKQAQLEKTLAELDSLIGRSAALVADDEI